MSETANVWSVFGKRGLDGRPVDSECFLSKIEVSNLIGISGRTLQSMMSTGEFPKPDKYFGIRPAWRLVTFNEWARKKTDKKG